MVTSLCFWVLIINVHKSIATIQSCSDSSDCLNQCTRNGICNANLCSYSSYKDEGRFCLTSDYAFSTCNGDGLCNEIDEEFVDKEPVKPHECESAERHRKPWHMITDEERDLYITGFKALYEKGVIATFTATHGAANTLFQAHLTSAFLPWHRYFIWELETQIRNLGGKYRCFTLPWWDSTDETLRDGEYYILSSGLGESGLEENNYCVEEGPFGRVEYTPSVCDGFNEDEECCLQRNTISWTQSRFLTPQATLKYITDHPVYGDGNIIVDERIDGFCRNVEGTPHGTLHVVIGGDIGHLGRVPSSPDDPVFYLLHASVDYLWALWQDCYNYDEVAAEDITNDIYSGLDEQVDDDGIVYGPSGIDDGMKFADLADAEWSLANERTLTPRDMHDIRAWDVSYEKGDFYHRAKVDELEELCLTINPEWFYDTIFVDKPQTPAEIFAEDTFTFLKYKQFSNSELKLQDTEERNRELLDAWSMITCEYNEFSLNKPCYRPRYFEDCGSDPKYEGVKGDIEISLDEILERVKSSECMMETRRMYYKWAKHTGRLMELCNGEYDHFCDNHFLKENENVVKSVNGMSGDTENTKSDNLYIYQIFSVIGGVAICLLVLVMVFGLLYVRKIKKIHGKSSILYEQEMMSYYGSASNKENDLF